MSGRKWVFMLQMSHPFMIPRASITLAVSLFCLGNLSACGRTLLRGEEENLGFSSSGGASTGGASRGGGPNSTGGDSGEKDCESDENCSASNACFLSVCLDSKCVESIRDADGDGFVLPPCVEFSQEALADCNDLNERVYPGAQENCTDGSDNDCNGVSDCFDPVCSNAPRCGCEPELAGENCENGLDDDCDGTIDCNDTDCVGRALCGCGPEQCGSGSDEDCDGRIDCEDDNCAGSLECTCRSRSENCENGLDDNCDGTIDCVDPQCRFDPLCLCDASSEVCSDGRDNDCDGLVDCGDPDCFSAQDCQNCTTERCASGFDEDCDGKIDCADPSCAFDAACPPLREQCNNGRDDDLDGQLDCDDDECVNVEICKEKQGNCLTARRISPLASAVYTGSTVGQLSHQSGSCGGEAGDDFFRLDLTEPTSLSLNTRGSLFDTVLYLRHGNCELGAELACDDDSGGRRWSSALEFPVLAPGAYFIVVDGLVVDERLGPDEGEYTLNVEVGPVVEVCGDGLDNDGNGFADCADDVCADLGPCKNCNSGSPPVAEYGTQKCTDGVDNDCDGLIDCEDSDCSASDRNPSECCNGRDQNGNGIVDDFACRCAADADCSFGQICYSSTLGTCGVPCELFVGDICPFDSPGSQCNSTTQQCEF